MSLSTQRVTDQLSRPEICARLETEFTNCISLSSFINAIGIYDQDGRAILYDKHVEIVPKEKQAVYYAEFGLICAPIFKSFREMRIGSPLRAGGAVSVESMGDPLSIRVEVSNHYIAMMPLDDEDKTFVLAVNWDTGGYGDKLFQSQLRGFVKLAGKILAG